MNSSRYIRSNFGALVAVGLLATSIGCKLHGSVDLNGSNHGHVQYKVGAGVGFSFSNYDAAGNMAVPQYGLDVQGYPYNRVVLVATYLVTASDGSTSTVPMTLVPGSRFPAAISMNGFLKTYPTTILATNDLPAGSYVLDAPGLVQDVQVILQESGPVPMSLTIPSDYVSPAYMAPPGFTTQSIQSSLDQVSNSDGVTITFSSTDLLPWRDLTTVSSVHPPIQHPTE